MLPTQAQSIVNNIYTEETNPPPPQININNPTRQNSMAILSPPSSRYAFDPNNSSNNDGGNLPVDSVLSPLLSPNSDANFANLNLAASSPSSSLNNANINSTTTQQQQQQQQPHPGYGTENDIPAFQPQTELLLENFTNDLNVFNNWITNLNVEEQKIAIGLFIDSIQNQEVLDFIKNKINLNLTSNLSTFSPALSTTTSSPPQNLRPVSPILPISSSITNPVPITLDSILNDTGNDNNNIFDNNNIDDKIYRPSPRRMLSPPLMKTGFSNLIDPIERPKSADPSYTNNYNNIDNFNSPFVDQMTQTMNAFNNTNTITNNNNNTNNNNTTNNPNTYNNTTYSLSNTNLSAMSPISSGFESQPLFRVLSDGFQELPENVSFNYYGRTVNNNVDNNNGMFLGTKLQQSLNTINNRSMIDSTKNANNNSNNNSNNNNYVTKEDRGRHRFLQNKGMHMNNINMTLMNHSNSNSGTNLVNQRFNGVYGNSSPLKGVSQSSSVPPNNRIRSNRGMVHSNSNNNNNNTTGNKNYHGYSKSGGNLNGVLNQNNGDKSSSNSLIENGDEKKKRHVNGGNTNSSNPPKDISCDELLEDIPAWLKTLRLHKYTENLQHLKWKDMIELNDEELSKLGVSTLGARNKLLKSFAYVKEKRGLS